MGFRASIHALMLPPLLLAAVSCSREQDTARSAQPAIQLESVTDSALSNFARSTVERKVAGEIVILDETASSSSGSRANCGKFRRTDRQEVGHYVATPGTVKVIWATAPPTEWTSLCGDIPY